MRTYVRPLYAELHAHSAFSFLDGTSLPDELAAAAVEQGHAAFALTDHDTVSGSMEFAQAARELDLRAIHGAEISVREDGVAPAPEPGRPWEPPPVRHITLLVRDATGWRNLCRLLTRAHSHTRGTVSGRQEPPAFARRAEHAFAHRAAPGVPDTAPRHAATAAPLRRSLAPSVTLADVAEHAEGLVCLTGCARQGIRDEPSVRRLLDAFGPDALRVELQRPFLRHDRALNRGLASLARRLELKTVATGNIHAHSRARARLQDAFVAIREHTTLDASEPLRRGNHAHVLTTPQAMAARFADHPEAVAETTALAEELYFDLTYDLGYRYPGADDGEADSTLAAVCSARFDERYPPNSRYRERAAARLQEELLLICRLGLSGFFNLHFEILELARTVASEVRGAETARALLPPGRGRGSSVSSIVCYLTGLSHIDPIANELFLGRFLNEEITALPDIDIDFPRDVREKLIPRIHEVYGHDRSALVAAFPTYRARGAIRELGKALGLPPGEIERVAKSSEGFSARKVDEDITTALGPERVEDGGRWAWLARLGLEAQGLPRHLSQHSGGMIVSTRPLVDCCPVVPAAMEGRQMVMWDKDSCSDAGFLKIDLLGLGMLSAVERCVEAIHARRGEFIDLSRIPYDDGPTYEAIQKAETTGVFQIESRAQMASLLRTQPKNLDDLTIQVAIVRPGPIQGGAVNPYIERLQRLRMNPSFVVPYEHESLRGPLADTLGTIIFQDQVIEVAMAFAGFSPGEAESLRRAMSRKRSAAAMDAHHDRFIEGAMRTHGVDAATAERVYAQISGFSGFGFPKAHGAAFGLLAYQSTWLRVHYGPEFLAALMDEQPMGFYPPDALVHEAQRRGIEVLAPDINASAVGCTVVPLADHRPAASSVAHVPPYATLPASLPGGAGERHQSAVQVGLGYVQGVRSDEIAALVTAREADGPFRSVEDLASRAGAGRPALAKLAWSGACDALVAGEVSSPGHRRRAALWRLGAALPGIRVRSGRVEHGTQLALATDLPAAPALPALGAWDSMIADYATTGMTASTHPIALLRPVLDERRAASSAALRTIAHNSTVRVGGLVVARQRPGTAKGIVFMLLEDEHGTINLIVPPDVYEAHRLIVRTEPLVVVEGRLERHPLGGGQVNVLVRTITALEAPGRPVAEIKDFSPLDLRELERQAADHRQAASSVAHVPPYATLPASLPGGAGDLPDVADGGDFRAVAPPVMNFGAGRR